MIFPGILPRVSQYLIEYFEFMNEMKEKDLEKTELKSEKSKKRRRCCRRPTLCEILLGEVFNRNLAPSDWLRELTCQRQFKNTS